MTDATARTIPTIAQMRDNSLSGVVRHEIETLILSGELLAGSRMNENAIALRLGVSRGPVREACRALVELGLLDLIPNRGVFVRRMDRHDVEEVYDLRAGLTGLAGSLVTARITDAEMDRLRALVAAMDESAAVDDFPSFYPVNLEFHDRLVEHCGQRRLAALYRSLAKELSLFRQTGLTQPGNLVISNAEHRAILDAVRSRDPRRAAGAMESHVDNAKQRMLKAVALPWESADRAEDVRRDRDSRP